jgi:hypothetical protein
MSQELLHNCAYIINTTPSYFYLLRLHLTCLNRYSGKMVWDVFLATEEPEHLTIKQLCEEFSYLKILSLEKKDAGFLDSRLAAVQALPARYDIVFPIQEDFLLEARPLWHIFKEAIDILRKDTTVHSIRMMPCPGPKTNVSYEGTLWKVLEKGKGDMLFSYQATLWKRSTYTKFLEHLITPMRDAGVPSAQRKKIEIHDNIAEIEPGQQLLASFGGIHLACPRDGPQPNAVYLAPWPYRPTAIVRGKLQNWAEELAERERVNIREFPSLR